MGALLRAPIFQNGLGAVESDPPCKLVKRTSKGRCCVTYVIEPVDDGSRLMIIDDRYLYNPIDLLSDICQAAWTCKTKPDIFGFWCNTTFIPAAPI